jgi:hypothetical protein
MNCKQFDRLLHLNRPGELSALETELLISHLKTCERCALEKVRIEQADILIERARRTVPFPSNPDQLIAATMRGLRAATSKPWWSPAFESILDFFWHPGVRLSAFAFVLVAFGTFSFQFLDMFNSIYELEQSVHQRTLRPPISATAYSVDPGAVKDLTDSKKLQALLPAGQYRVSDGQIIVRQSDIASILSAVELRSLTTNIAASVLHIEKSKLDRIVENISKHATMITKY